MSFTALSATHFGKINRTGKADHSNFLSDSQVNEIHTQSWLP